jgi:hypothetical protein
MECDMKSKLNITTCNNKEESHVEQIKLEPQIFHHYSMESLTQEAERWRKSFISKSALVEDGWVSPSMTVLPIALRNSVVLFQGKIHGF